VSSTCVRASVCFSVIYALVLYACHSVRVVDAAASRLHQRSQVPFFKIQLEKLKKRLFNLRACYKQ